MPAALPRTLLLAVAAAAAAHAAAPAAHSETLPQDMAGDSAHFALTSTLAAAPITPRFVGFSIEVGSTPSVFLLGGLGGVARPSFATLMNALRAASGAQRGPNIRIGGNSADESAWVPGTAPLPENTTYRITQADLDAYRLAVPAWNGSLQIDTTLRYARDPSFTVAHIAAARKALGVMDVDEGGLIEAIEIGNEPDLFGENGARPADYDYAQYKVDYATYLAAITASGVLAGVTPRVQGAAWCSPHWNASWQDFTQAFKASLSSLSFHTYSQTACHGNTHSSVPGLLSNNITARFAAEVAAPLAAARAAGIPFKIGEGNSVSCGGRAGVSDVFASALWAMDILFTAADLGLQRWNFHGMPAGPYSAIAYANATTNAPSVRPLFYGLLAFAAATGSAGGSARVLAAATVASSNEYIRCWSVWDAAANATRVVVLHKDPAATGSAAVTVSTRGSGALLSARGSLVRLLGGAKGMLAQWQDGITWQGQTYSGSVDGTPVGQRVAEAVQADASGDFVFTLPAASAAVLTLEMAF